MFGKDRRDHNPLMDNLIDIVVARTASKFEQIKIRLLLLKPKSCHGGDDANRPYVLIRRNRKPIDHMPYLVRDTNEVRLRNHLTIYADSFQKVNQVRAGKKPNSIS